MADEIRIADRSWAAAPATPTRLKRLEALLACSLPEGLRTFFLSANGGVPELQGIEGDVVTRFLAVCNPDSLGTDAAVYDVESILELGGERFERYELDECGECPVELLPFAELFSGDYLCLDYGQTRGSPGREPSVVVWRHELSEDLAPYLEPVARTFEEFVGKLRSLES